MIFSIDRTPLLQALQKLQTVVEKKNTVQILGNVLFSLVGNELSLCATDLDVGLKVVLPVDGSQDGKTTISVKHLLEIVRELPEKKLRILKKQNDWINLSCEKSNFNIVSLSADQYPYLPHFEEKHYYETQTTALIEMIDRTQFAICSDTTRFQLNGVFFEQLENKMMRMTATDSHRLSFYDQEIFLNSPDITKGMMIPRKGLLELRKLLDEKIPTIGFNFEPGYIFTKIDNCYLFIHLSEGEYPDYKPVIPNHLTQKARIERTSFLSALRRVSLLTSEKSRGVKMVFRDNSVMISSSSPEVGEAQEEVDVEFDGQGVEIAFNSKYLIECLSVMKTEKIEFSLKDRLSAGVLRELNRHNHIYVIMPMRIER